MRRRLPGWACFDWWWLLVFLLADVGAFVAIEMNAPRFVGLFRLLPDWWIVWSAVQAFIVMRRLENGWSFYLYLAAAFVGVAQAISPHGWQADLWGLLLFGVWFAAVMRQWGEFERAFGEDGRIEKLNGWLVLFVSVFYFQYKLHQMYERERSTESKLPAA